jgi:hypothetical protein
MYYYGNGYGGAPMAGGYYPCGGQSFPAQSGNNSLWAIILVIFILFIIIGCGWGGRGCGNWSGCC